MSKLLYEVRGQFYKGERIYEARKLELYHRLRDRPKIMKSFLR